MAYSQSKKLTDAEKKLQSLRMQLYGKERNDVPEAQKKSSPPKSGSFQYTSPTIKSTPAHSEPAENNYLKKDLLKTLALATLAITAQLLLYFSLNKVHGG